MTDNTINAVMTVHRLAFGAAEGNDIADLVQCLLNHPETISVSVARDGKIVGNTLFTPFGFDNHPATRCVLLSPCGVLPEHQGQGVGKEMMETSIEHLKRVGTDAVFVLGVPSFYPRFGFVPTDKQTPYPDLMTLPEAWMVLELTPGAVAPLEGRTRAVPEFMQPQLWDMSPHP